eukprot:1158956-Pelagomonas_calceolata.AAC.2
MEERQKLQLQRPHGKGSRGVGRGAAGGRNSASSGAAGTGSASTGAAAVHQSATGPSLGKSSPRLRTAWPWSGPRRLLTFGATAGGGGTGADEEIMLSEIDVLD